MYSGTLSKFPCCEERQRPAVLGWWVRYVVAAKTGLVRLERLGIILRRCDKRAKLDGADALFTSKRYEDTLMPQENAMQSHLHAKAFNARSLHARNTQHLNRYADLERLRR